MVTVISQETLFKRSDLFQDGRVCPIVKPEIVILIGVWSVFSILIETNDIGA